MANCNYKELEAYEDIIHHLKVLNEVKTNAGPEEKAAVKDILLTLLDLRDYVCDADVFMKMGVPDIATAGVN